MYIKSRDLTNGRSADFVANSDALYCVWMFIAALLAEHLSARISRLYCATWSGAMGPIDIVLG